MATDYPGDIDSFSTKTDEVTDVMAADVNDLQDAVEAIETELGSDPAGTAADVKTRLAQSLDGLGNLDFKAIGALTISGGSVTPTQNWHVVDTEGSAASDDLDTIAVTNVTDGFILFLRQANDARDVTIKHDTGNIKCPGGVDIALADTTQVVMLIYDGTLTKWLASICPSNVALTNKSNTWAAEQIFTKSERRAYTSVSSNTTLDATQNIVDVDASGGAITITLPTAVGINGREYVIRKLDSSANTVTITPNGSETVNGSSDIVLDEQYESTIIYSDGANWIQLATGGGGGSSSDLIEHTHTGSTDGGLLRLDTISAPTDSTSLNASTDAHGLLPKLSGTATEYMDGSGAWSTPAGGSSDLAEHTHASSDTGGLIRLDTITAPTDSTSLNASTDMHGLLPKLSGSSDEYMNGIGEWGTPAGGGGGASSDLIEHTHTGSTDGGLLRLDTIAAPTDSTSLNASTDAHGLLPKLSGNLILYLRSDGAWATEHVVTSDTWGAVNMVETSDFIIGTTDGLSNVRFVSPDNFNALMRSGTTDFDASTDTHGLLPKLSGTATEFLDGTGAWSTPSGASTDLAEHDHSDSDNGGIIRLDTIAAPTDTTANDVSISAHGLFPKLPGTSDTYWNGKGEWGTATASVATATTDTAGINMIASSSDINAGTTDNLMLGTNVFTKSNYGIRFCYAPINGSTALAAGDKAYFPIPTEMSGWNLVSVRATCGANSSTDATVFTVKKGGGTQTLLSTNITIDPTLTDSLASSDQPVISSSDNPVTSTDIIEVAATSDCGAGMTYAGVLTGWQLP